MELKIIPFMTFLIFILSGCSLFGEIQEFGCGLTSDDTQAHCYRNAAGRTNNPDTCDKIKDVSDVGNAPRNGCYQDLARQNNDPAYCNKITDPGTYSTTKDACILAVSRISSKDNDLTELECKWDSDCSPICEGDTYWKQGCDIRLSKCIKTFDTRCPDTVDKRGENKYPHICMPDKGCIKDIDAINNDIENVKKGIKELGIQLQQTKSVFEKSSRNCRQGLSDVTNNLIVGAAKDIGFPVTTIADAIVPYVEQGLSMLLKDSFKAYTPTMPVEDFVILNCNLEKTMKQEVMPGIQKSHDDYRQKLYDLCVLSGKSECTLINA